MVETVRKNYDGFTKEQVMRAAEVRDAMAMMAHPSEDKFKKHVVSSGHVVKNFNLTLQDIANANALFGLDRGNLKGKTVQQTPGKVRPEYISIPRDLYERIKNVTLTADVMFVNGAPFLMTLSRKIRLVTAKYLQPWMAKQLGSLLTKVVNLYARGGFTVCTILMDQEFDKVTDLLPNVEVNTTAACEHIAEIKRMHRTIKEHARRTRAMLPFAHLPKPIVINLI